MKEKRMKLLEKVMKGMTEEYQKEWVWQQMQFCIPDLISDMSDEEVEEELLKLG